MSIIFYGFRLLRYKIYRIRLNLINKNRIKRGELPISDRYGMPWKTQSLCNHPTAEEIRKRNQVIKPLGILFYLEYKIKNPNKDE